MPAGIWGCNGVTEHRRLARRATRPLVAAPTEYRLTALACRVSVSRRCRLAFHGLAGQ